MKLYSREYLTGRSDQELRNENFELEARQRAIRAVRMQLAEELERRAGRGTLVPEAQVVTPALLVADVEVGGQRKKRWFRR